VSMVAASDPSAAAAAAEEAACLAEAAAHTAAARVLLGHQMPPLQAQLCTRSQSGPLFIVRNDGEASRRFAREDADRSNLQGQQSHGKPRDQVQESAIVGAQTMLLEGIRVSQGKREVAGPTGHAGSSAAASSRPPTGKKQRMLQQPPPVAWEITGEGLCACPVANSLPAAEATEAAAAASAPSEAPLRRPSQEDGGHGRLEVTPPPPAPTGISPAQHSMAVVPSTLQVRPGADCEQTTALATVSSLAVSQPSPHRFESDPGRGSCAPAILAPTLSGLSQAGAPGYQAIPRTRNLAMQSRLLLGQTPAQCRRSCTCQMPAGKQAT
jgi:hypothetical protein